MGDTPQDGSSRNAATDVKGAAGRSRSGRIRLVHRIGSGGMAEVWKARLLGPEGFEKPVAVKRLHAGFDADPQFAGMLAHEATLVARLKHPNIVEVYDLQRLRRSRNACWCVALELVEGVDLAVLLARMSEQQRRLPVELALFIARETARGLAAAHDSRGDDGEPLGIVHRDVSPQNLLLSRRGEVKLTDFGIARILGARSSTGIGVLKGKLAYMSPEQLRMQPIDGRSDLFALGLVLFEMLSGRRRVQGETVDEVTAGALGAASLSAEDLPGAPPGVVAVVRRALEPEPSARFAHAEEMEEALDALLAWRDRDAARALAGLVAECLGAQGESAPAASDAGEDADDAIAAELSLDVSRETSVGADSVASPPVPSAPAPAEPVAEAPVSHREEPESPDDGAIHPDDFASLAAHVGGSIDATASATRVMEERRAAAPIRYASAPEDALAPLAFPLPRGRSSSPATRRSILAVGIAVAIAAPVLAAGSCRGPERSAVGTPPPPAARARLAASVTPAHAETSTGSR